MRNENYYVVQGWMINKLNLSGFEKDIYAVIYGMCQAYDESIIVSLEYLASAANCTKITAIRSIKKLLERELIFKENVIIKNRTQNRYYLNKKILEELCYQSQNVTGDKMSNYNPIYKNKTKKQGTKTTKPHTVKKDSTLIKHKGPITPSMLGPENIGKRVLFRPETSKITLKSDFLSKTPISVVMNYLEGDKAVFSEFEAFLQSLRDMNLKLTPSYVKRQIDLLNTLRDEDDKLTVLRKTMESGWKSLRFVIEDEFGKNLQVKIKTGGKKTNEKRKTY